jgi:hypothetical protein
VVRRNQLTVHATTFTLLSIIPEAVGVIPQFVE